MEWPVRRLGVIGLVLLALLVGVGAGVVLDRNMDAVLAAPALGANQGLDTRLINEAWNLLQRHYVDRPALKPKEQTYAAISGMVQSLGDTGHTVFLTPEMVRAEQTLTQGHFEGIGAEVENKDGHVVIAAPFDNSPAQKAGVRPGDIIVKVDGQDMTGLSASDVVSRVLGPAGTKVTLTLRDPKTQQTRDVTIVRARIDIPSVVWRMLPGTKVAHVRVASFSESVSADLQKALADAQKDGATAIVLDLRNNPGGLLDGAVNVASQFLKSGNVLQTRDAQGNISATPVKADVPKTDLPVVVLTNAGTASAAEIVAGALQDGRRAQLVGETTFGTGTVVTQFPLSDGSALMIAIQEWLTPGGRTIWHQGIKPDVTVALPADTTPLFPDQEKDMTPAQLQASHDAQLLRALQLLGQKP